MTTEIAQIAPQLRHEPLSPFVAWSAADRAPIPDDPPEAASRPSLLVDLLRSPGAIVERVLDPARLQGAVLGSLAAIAGGTGLFAGAVADATYARSPAVAAAMIAADTLIGVAAAFGPIYATSILLAARLPLARLVATMLAAAAAGALILGGLAPVPYVLFKLDFEWAGPVSLMGSFLFAAIVSGSRVRALLGAMALQVTRAATGDPAAKLGGDDELRVGVLSRVAMMLLAFTSALSFWAFDALF